MQIEEGKFYSTRDGHKVGPMVNKGWDDGEPWTAEHYGYYGDNGKWNTRTDSLDPHDLVAIWQDEPVVTETVTKTRIVPGVYDGVTVGRGQLDKPNGKRVEVTFDYWATADELDAAAAVLSALAKGLRDAN